MLNDLCNYAVFSLLLFTIYTYTCILIFDKFAFKTSTCQKVMVES